MACRRQLIKGESAGDRIPGCILRESLFPGDLSSAMHS